jgi:hypothetical protein
MAAFHFPVAASVFDPANRLMRERIDASIPSSCHFDVGGTAESRIITKNTQRGGTSSDVVDIMSSIAGEHPPSLALLYFIPFLK